LFQVLTFKEIMSGSLPYVPIWFADLLTPCTPYQHRLGQSQGHY